MDTRKTPQQMKRGLVIHAISYVVVNLVAVVLWSLLTPKNFFWPLYSLGAWGIGLAFHGWAVHAPPRQVRRHPSSRD